MADGRARDVDPLADLRVGCARVTFWNLGMACGWRCLARVLGRRRPVRRRTASRHRHRSRRCSRCQSSVFRRGHVCRAGSNARPDGDDRDRRWSQGLADAPRAAARPARGCRRGRGAHRRTGPVRRAGARCPVRPSRDSCRGHRYVCRSPLAPSVADCPDPFPATRGAACTSSGSFSRPCSAAARIAPTYRCARSSSTCPGRSDSDSGSDSDLRLGSDPGLRAGRGAGGRRDRRGRHLRGADDRDAGGRSRAERSPEHASGAEREATLACRDDREDVRRGSPNSRGRVAHGQLADNCLTTWWCPPAGRRARGPFRRATEAGYHRDELRGESAGGRCARHDRARCRARS